MYIVDPQLMSTSHNDSQKYSVLLAKPPAKIYLVGGLANKERKTSDNHSGLTINEHNALYVQSTLHECPSPQSFRGPSLQFGHNCEQSIVYVQ